MSDPTSIFYTIVDKELGVINFHTDHYTYKTLRSALLALGIDIDSIQTEQSLLETERRHRDHICRFIELRSLNQKNPGLERRLLNAIILGDFMESDRITKLLETRNRIGLHVVI